MAKIDLLVVIAYMAAILAAGFWARRKATTQDEFLVAGRSVGPWLYTGTLAAVATPKPVPLTVAEPGVPSPNTVANAAVV